MLMLRSGIAGVCISADPLWLPFAQGGGVLNWLDTAYWIAINSGDVRGKCRFQLMDNVSNGKTKWSN